MQKILYRYQADFLDPDLMMLFAGRLEGEVLSYFDSRFGNPVQQRIWIQNGEYLSADVYGFRWFETPEEAKIYILNFQIRYYTKDIERLKQDILRYESVIEKCKSQLQALESKGGAATC